MQLKLIHIVSSYMIFNPLEIYLWYFFLIFNGFRIPVGWQLGKKDHYVHRVIFLLLTQLNKNKYCLYSLGTEQVLNITRYNYFAFSSRRNSKKKNLISWDKEGKEGQGYTFEIGFIFILGRKIECFFLLPYLS